MSEKATIADMLFPRSVGVPFIMVLSELYFSQFLYPFCTLFVDGLKKSEKLRQTSLEI